MASSTQPEMSEEIAVQLSPEEKESLDEIIKEAESELESREVLDQSLAIVAENEGLDKDAAANLIIYTVAGVLKNLTKGPLSVMDKHIYAGHFVKPFPSPIAPGKTGTFIITNTSAKGVEAGVVYTGNNKNNVPCGWLLAFVDNKANGMRIYGECGNKNKFIKIDWTKVEQNLLKAGKVVNIQDPATGTSLKAIIRGYNDKAAVGAIFLG